MNHYLSRLISAAFNPLIMPTYLFFILYLFSPIIIAPFNPPYFVAVIFITTFIIPYFSLWMMYKVGTLKTLRMDDRQERILPFTFTGVFYTVITYMFISQFKVNTAIVVVLGAITFTIFFVSMVNIFWKISAHSAGVMGTIGFLVAFNMKIPGLGLLLPILFMILLAGAIMSARLSLNIHNISQVAAGSAAGFLICFCSVMYLV